MSPEQIERELTDTLYQFACGIIPARDVHRAARAYGWKVFLRNWIGNECEVADEGGNLRYLSI